MKHSVIAALVLAVTLALTACSPAADNTDGATGDQTVITFRLWDDNAAAAYRESFDKFQAENPNVVVEIEVLPWDKYFDQLALDVASGEMADVYWTNSSNFAKLAESGNLMNITQELGTDHDEWQQSVVDLYTRDGSLWGVPQLWDSIALYYQKDLVKQANIDVNNLTWAPGAGKDDTLLPAAQKLTVDAAGNTADSPDFDAANTKVFGFNAQADLQAIYLNFLGENGAALQGTDDALVFASDAGIAAFQYLVDLINKYQVAPPAAETNTNGDITKEMFIRGELALYQSGPYNLKDIAENATHEWALAPMVAGPEGRTSVVHGVAAVGNSKTAYPAQTVQLLQWLGSAAGQLPLAKNGVSFPGAVAAQEAFVNYWAEKGIDVAVFIDAANGNTIPAPYGTQINGMLGAAHTKLLDVFLGAVPVPAGVQAAQEAGNAQNK
ncbi:MAG: extracellular solute-binding protein [Trueperella sp.]|nr:extracellular solute-binding protein [Trueperella sp.]